MKYAFGLSGSFGGKSFPDNRLNTGTMITLRSKTTHIHGLLQ